MRRCGPILLAVTALACGQKLELTPPVVRQGETVRVRSAVAAVSARMNGRTIRMFAQADGGWLGLMPVPALEKPGTYEVQLLTAGDTIVSSAPVTVRDAHFPIQNVVMTKAIAGLQPSPGETETTSAFRTTVTDERRWKEPFAAPVPGCLVSPFGVRRFHNGKPTGSYHGGVDLRAAAGQPVHAASGGMVRIARQFNVHGGTVAIDHGQGLGTMYLHLSKFAVAEGALVNTGDVIGYAGSTGRSTAPHLHWSVYVNGVPVNPRQWVRLQRCGRPAKR